MAFYDGMTFHRVMTASGASAVVPTNRYWGGREEADFLQNSAKHLTISRVVLYGAFVNRNSQPRASFPSA